MRECTANVRFRGQSGQGVCIAKCLFMTRTEKTISSSRSLIGAKVVCWLVVNPTERCCGHFVSTKAAAKSGGHYHEGFGAPYAQTSQQDDRGNRGSGG